MNTNPVSIDFHRPGKATLSTEELRSFVAVVVAEVLASLDYAIAPMPAEQLAYCEPDAASLIGVRTHVLRDARLRGEIEATKIGGRIGYMRSDLINYLQRNRDAK